MKLRKAVALLASAILNAGVLGGCGMEAVDPLDVVYTNENEEVTIRQLFECSEEVLANANYLYVSGLCHSDSPGGQTDENKFEYRYYYNDDDNYESVLEGHYKRDSIAAIFNDYMKIDRGYEYYQGKNSGQDVEYFSDYNFGNTGSDLNSGLVDVDVRKVLFPDLTKIACRFDGKNSSGHYYVSVTGDLSCYNGSFGNSMDGSRNLYEVCYIFSADTHVLERVTFKGLMKVTKEYVKGEKTELTYSFNAEFKIEESSYGEQEIPVP